MLGFFWDLLSNTNDVKDCYRLSEFLIRLGIDFVIDVESLAAFWPLGDQQDIGVTNMQLLRAGVDLDRNP